MTIHTHPRYPHPPLVVEVSGDFACFTRPELKAERFSYEVMTPSAACGVLRSIFWKPEIDYRIVRIEVLSPIRWFALRRNEVKSMLTEEWVRRALSDPAVRYDVEDDRDQRNAVVLRDVAYRIHAQMILAPHATAKEDGYRAQFRRRLDRGACFSQPFLGTREFTARFGKRTAARPISGPDANKELGVMLHTINYQSGGHETYEWFFANLIDGVLHVPFHGLELPSAGPTTRAGGTHAD